jgi:short-chain fatty acids transporter
MISRIGIALSRAAARTVPDPFVLALGLTAVVFAAGWIALCVTGTGSGTATTLLEGWYDGFRDPAGLAFALQMCLVLVTGHALATSPPVQKIVRAIAALPRSTAAAALVVAAVACFAGVIHWGLGAVVGALLAREIACSAAARGTALNYPLLGAAAYAGFAVWHGGFSGSAPLKVAEEGHFAAAITGVLSASETIFSPLNLAVTGVLLAGIPLLFLAMSPRGQGRSGTPAASPPDGQSPSASAPEPGLLGLLQDRPWAGWVLGGVGLVGFAVLATRGGLGFDLNAVNLVFLLAGIGAHGSLRRYVSAIADGARGAGAIVLQFPFYFGILGIMKASGLVALISEGFAAAATPTTFPLLTYLSAGLVNLFVPSGGGQWAVQGEILVTAGRALGVDPSTTVMAFAYGDAWTNMLQPFWALPLLGITGLRARDIIGYTAVVFLAMLVAVPTLLWIFG